MAGRDVRIRVLRPGLLTTVQDLGRWGYQKYGVTVGGAMDTAALRIANLLVGNDESAAGLELTLVGPTLRFEGDALLAICGGDLTPCIDGRPAPAWRPVGARSGATLSFAGAASGCRAYLAVAGGIDVPIVLGSRSTCLRAGFGGLDGRPLRDGDLLPVGRPSELSDRLLAGLAGEETSFSAPRWRVGGAAFTGYCPDPLVRVMRGPEFDRLARGSRSRLFADAFRIAPESDRMGYRLEGPRLELGSSAELVSEGIAAGTLQLPPGGRPIALLADRQTTGGYARIGQIAGVDLPVMAQLKPGDAVHFQQISLPDAQALTLAREHEIREIAAAIRLAARG